MYEYCVITKKLKDRGFCTLQKKKTQCFVFFANFLIVAATIGVVMVSANGNLLDVPQKDMRSVKIVQQHLNNGKNWRFACKNKKTVDRENLIDAENGIGKMFWKD